jgi:Peptidase of plants and bacteria
VITFTLSTSYRGVSGMSGTYIVGSPDHFRKHRQDDVGAIVHETVHVAQGYRRGDRPSWLVEGMGDYFRFFYWEPGKLGRIDPKAAHYNKSYRVTAAFLAYLVQRYDKDLVRKLNRVLREGLYEEGVFEQLTGKTVQQLDDEWRATLR